ncbi:hypothetical protein ERO13_A08G154150v2 [Gossypium hirsutum]|uniref:Uncharacterized protein n=1 Tax=Gossypium darwinii TaxID=34276 RepID=A0A5D2FKV8_GOSDA|nr:hypothetical protein ERO13_A08G154150v2 [Gossypium hirsutum]TYH06785.1 hypothetical protein ES288_A08G181000v1 [Gossypium darwinii]
MSLFIEKYYLGERSISNRTDLTSYDFADGQHFVNYGPCRHAHTQHMEHHESTLPRTGLTKITQEASFDE